MKMVKAEKSIPTAVGFGISRPDQAYDMARKSDGVIVGYCQTVRKIWP